ISSLADLDRDGVKLVVGAQGVPVGDYTRDVLEKAHCTDVLRHAVSEEQDVKALLDKMQLGEADAGFVYATDVRAAGGEVRAIELPTTMRVTARYPVAVVSATGHEAEAERFIAHLRGAEGRRLLREAGFGLP